jgi:hypothetical protein
VTNVIYNASNLTVSSWEVKPMLMYPLFTTLRVMLLLWLTFGLAPLLWSQSPGPIPKEVAAKVEGTGRTTSHVLNIVLTNRSDANQPPIEIELRDPIITRTDVNTPSYNRHNGSQIYRGFLDTTVVLEPGQTIRIPVEGVCLTNDVPPLGDGEAGSHPNDWIWRDDESITPITPGFIPQDTSGFVFQSDETGPTLTYPGTSIEFPYTIDVIRHTREAAPLIYAITDQIHKSVTHLQNTGKITSPFSGNPELEFEVFWQQTTWIAIAVLEGRDYSQEKFEDNLKGQFKDQYGMDIDQADSTVQQTFQSGVENFWEGFHLTGTDAKIYPEEETYTAPDPDSDTFPCVWSYNDYLLPPLDLDVQIASAWKDQVDRDTIIQQTTRALEGGFYNPDDVFGVFNISNNPTSATAFWRTLMVGGYASAYAKTDFQEEGSGSEWVSGTEPLNASAEGSSQFTMTMDGGRDCSGYVVGVSLSRIKATSRAFDAMAGNELGQNETDQLAFLKGVKAGAKIAMQYLIQRAGGRTQKPFGTFVRDAAQEYVEGEISAAMQSELEELVGEEMAWIMQNVDFQGGWEQFLDLGINEIQSRLADWLGFDPFDVMGEAMNTIDEGLEAFLNSFFWSNTYATANGSLVIQVGNVDGSIMARSNTLLSREAQEETQEAMTTTGPQCREMLLSDVQPGSLTIETTGFSNMAAEAQNLAVVFGNGNASAELESQQLQALVGICICPDQPRPLIVTFVNHGWYLAEQNNSLEQVQGQVEKGLNDHLQHMINEGQLTNDSSPEDFETAAAQYIQNWGAEHPYRFSSCNNQ